MPAALSSSQIAAYQNRGVLFPATTFSKRELSGYAQKLAELESHCGGQVKGYRGSQLHLFFSWAHELATHPKLLDLVEGILGPSFLIHSSTLFCKYPFDASFVSWHQDSYYWRLSEPRLVSAWIAFSDSTQENGCMRVMPGSHRGPILPHHNAAIDERNLLRSGLVLKQMPRNEEALDVRLKAGQVSLHHANLIHGSGPNHSAHKRSGFAIRYVADGVSQRGPHHQVVLARGSCSGGSYSLADPPPPREFHVSFQEHREFCQRLRQIRGHQGRPATETSAIPTT